MLRATHLSRRKIATMGVLFFFNLATIVSIKIVKAFQRYQDTNRLYELKIRQRKKCREVFSCIRTYNNITL